MTIVSSVLAGVIIVCSGVYGFYSGNIIDRMWAELL
jgi:hypothetical protein